MKFSCSLPLFEAGSDEVVTLSTIAETARAVEDAGLDAVYVTDHPAPSQTWLSRGGHPTLDPFVALTAAAAATRRLKVQTHILVLPYRNPFVVAKSAASLDALSGGRFIMGIGTGYLKSEYAALGVSFDDRGEITDEAIRVMRKAWTGEPVQHDGPRFSARDAVVQPRPVRTDGVPIWAGGNARPAIRRAVELCDGWCPFPAEGSLSATARTEELATITQLREKLDYAGDYAQKIGRSEPLTICMARLGSKRASMQDPASALEAVDDYCRLAEAGVTWTTIAIAAPSRAAFADNVRWFAEKVARKVAAK